ncbi:archaellin/type IV pilin N-terminal domain-containing protein [Halorientalis salina]|uniref:archaellin/type IV pilin N-terminal domain-containing protein n=1 Tax=Halorientalis salina TaxID=2932266 RepID=UPI0021174202|nr:archaellin/type IV pilin N-terminal domain-containing protein [Halorientalis salina]
MFDIDDETKEELRGQVGIGTLIVFIAMVLVAAIAAGVLINTAGFLQSKSEETGQQSGEQVTNRLQVLQTTGMKTGQDDSTVIGGVEMVATKSPGAEDIAIEGITMQWVDNTGSYDLVHENVYTGNVDGAFAQSVVKDTDGSIGEDSPVINSNDDRVRLVIDVGDSDYDESSTVEQTKRIADAYNELDDYSYPDDLDVDKGVAKRIIRDSEDGLEEGSTASIRITTQSGTATTLQLTVPESLSGKTAARL